MREVLCNTREAALRCLRILAASNHVTYDTETSGLDWKTQHIVGYVITPKGEDSMYVPIRHAGGGNLPGDIHIPQDPQGWRGDLHWFEIELAKVANERPRHWVGHYLLFDMRFSNRHGIRLYGTHEDTGVNEPLIDENLRRYSLDACAQRRGVQAKKGDELYQHLSSRFGGPADKTSMQHFWRSNGSEPVVWEYAAGDGVTTEEVWVSQQIDLDEDQEHEILDAEGKLVRIADWSLRPVQGVENRLINVLFRMTTGGIRIDEDALVRADRHFASEADKIKAQFPAGFKSNAPSHLKEYLAHRIDDRWPRNAVTAAQRKKASKEGVAPVGALKFDEATLKLVPEGRAIVAARKLEHACSSFTRPMMERHLFKGRVHCDFAQMAADDFGTISGRLSCYDPNLQQVPKRDKVIAPEYRKCFLPDEGHIWYDNDYKQQEYVVFADYTGDPALARGYSQNPPVDIHQTVADMLGIERDPGAKRMNLGMLYGMGIEKLALSLGVSIAQAQKWMAEYHRKMPAARKFLKNAERRAKNRGYVRTYLGRRRRFEAWLAYKAGNGIIQGSSADITKLKMVEVDEYFASEGDIFRLMLQCHDSLSWSGPEDRPDINAEALRIMGNFGPGQLIHMDVPLGIDSDTGRNWSEAVWGRED